MATLRSIGPSLLVLTASLLPASTLSCDRLGGHASEGSLDGASAAASASAAAPAAPTAPAAAASSLAFLGDFEGVIDGFTRDSTKPGAPQVTLSALVKAGSARLEIPDGLSRSVTGNPLGGKGYVLFDPAAKKLTMVSDAKREAIVMNLNSGARGPSGMTPPGGTAHPGAPASPSKITRTGKTDTVAGYSCEYWDVTSDHRSGTVCMSSDGPSWLSIPASGFPGSGAWIAQVMDGKHFPLRFIGYGKDGTTEENRVEITRIAKQPVPDATFQVPAGYRTIDLDQMMMGGLGGMPGMPGMPPGMPPGMAGMPGMPGMPSGPRVPPGARH